jgi:hypothetical protein
MDGLEGLISANAGGWAAFVTLVVSLVTAVSRGWLVPRRTVELVDAAAQRTATVQAERLADSREREIEWKGAWMSEKARGDLQADQIGDLLEQGRTTLAAIESLKRVATGETS